MRPSGQRCCGGSRRNGRPLSSPGASSRRWATRIGQHESLRCRSIGEGVHIAPNLGPQQAELSLRAAGPAVLVPIPLPAVTVPAAGLASSTSS